MPVVQQGGPTSASNVRKLVNRDGQAAGLPFPAHPDILRHAREFKLANGGHDTRALRHYLGHKNILHTARHTEMAPDRFRTLWRDYGIRSKSRLRSMPPDGHRRQLNKLLMTPVRGRRWRDLPMCGSATAPIDYESPSAAKVEMAFQPASPMPRPTAPQSTTGQSGAETRPNDSAAVPSVCDPSKVTLLAAMELPTASPPAAPAPAAPNPPAGPVFAMRVAA